jgi:hypothetical protein
MILLTYTRHFQDQDSILPNFYFVKRTFFCVLLLSLAVLLGLDDFLTLQSAKALEIVALIPAKMLEIWTRLT